MMKLNPNPLCVVHKTLDLVHAVPCEVHAADVNDLRRTRRPHRAWMRTEIIIFCEQFRPKTVTQSNTSLGFIFTLSFQKDFSLPISLPSQSAPCLLPFSNFCVIRQLGWVER